MATSVSNTGGTFANLGSGRYKSDDRFPDPFCDIASMHMPTSIQEALRWCYVPGTPIELANFSLKPIEDVRPGDRVLTRGGTHESVVAYSARYYEGELVRVEFDGIGKDLPWLVTPQHKVYRIPGDGRSHSKTAVVFSPDSAVLAMAGDLQVGDYIATPLPIRPADKAPRFSGWLFGMYLAEGCPIENGRGQYGIRFTLGVDDEVLGVTEKLCELLQRQLGLHVDVYTPLGRPDVRLVTVWDMEFADWCCEHGGRNADQKSLSARVLAYGDDFLSEMLIGFADGDGWVRHDEHMFGGFGLSTSSQSLAYQFQRVGQLVGIRASILQCKNDRGYGVPDGVGYQVRLLRDDVQHLVQHSVKFQRGQYTHEPKTASHSAVLIKDGYVYRRVTAVSREAYAGTVHNFEVTNDHSYVAGGVLTGNCEYIMLANGIYRQAIERIIAYFLTDVLVRSAKPDQDLGKEERDKYETFLSDTLGIKKVLHTVARDYLTYGNSFTSLILPIRRSLACKTKGCGYEMPLRKMHKTAQLDLSWDNFEFTATCPCCKKRGTWTKIDRRSGDPSQIRIKRWSPHEIEIIWDPYTDKMAYIWKIPEDYKRLIREGDIDRLEDANWEVVEAIKANRDFRFDNGALYHMKEDALAGMRNRGWGISRVLTNFRQAWYVQILFRFNEAIALDYVIPFRVITPQPRAGGDAATSDPVNLSSMSGFVNRVNRMLRERKRDPARWNVSPYSLQYQALGGEATQLAPKDLMDQGLDTLLTCIGIPVEFYKGTLAIQSAPAALRLLEANWAHLVHQLNGFVTDLVTQVSRALQWEQVTAQLERVTHADDLNRQMAKLQLMTQSLVSKETGLRSIGADFKEEAIKTLEEERFLAEQQQKMTENMDQQQQMQQLAPPIPPMSAAPGQQGAGAPGQGASAQGGAPAPAAGGDPAAAAMQPPPTAVDQFIMSRVNTPNVPRTPEELNAQAQVIVQDLLARPETQKDSLLIKLKKVDPTMHALVRVLLEDANGQMEQQGKQMIQQQMGKAAEDATVSLAPVIDNWSTTYRRPRSFDF